MRKFNVTGVCVPAKDYMVDISNKLEQIMELITDGCYFTINRARQYGKTTTLSMIQKTLPSDYICIRISFQGISDESFKTEEAFCKMFIKYVIKALKRFNPVSTEYINLWNDENVNNINDLSEHISKICENRKVVLMIDEVDQTSQNRVFVLFIAMLREKFLLRKEDMDDTFHNVILAGVYDIKNIKLKLIDEGIHIQTATEDKAMLDNNLYNLVSKMPTSVDISETRSTTNYQSVPMIYNSPWNIAVDFTVDMSFNSSEIATMLVEYESDHNMNIDIATISKEIYRYTNGYPFLVSRICQCIDEEINKDWTVYGIQRAVKILLSEKNTLFDDVFKNLENNKDLNKYIYELLVLGELKPYVIYDSIVSTGDRYGFFLKQNNGSDRVAISNRIFEILITDYFIAKDLRDKKQITGVLYTDVINDGRFNMELCLRKFSDHYTEIFNKSDIEFLERHGRLLFLSYLRPLINGQGFYHIESQFTDLRRMDIVVDFGCEQFIIELKRWRGEQYQAEAYAQLCGYLDSKHTDTGYLLTFDFRSEGNKTLKAEWIEMDGKRIFDVMV